MTYRDVSGLGLMDKDQIWGLETRIRPRLRRQGSGFRSRDNSQQQTSVEPLQQNSCLQVVTCLTYGTQLTGEFYPWAEKHQRKSVLSTNYNFSPETVVQPGMGIIHCIGWFEMKGNREGQHRPNECSVYMDIYKRGDTFCERRTNLMARKLSLTI